MANNHTEGEMIEALFQKYSPLGKKLRNWMGDTSLPALQQYVCASHVRSAAGWDSKRTIDFLVFDTHNTASAGYSFHGFEIKCSRADWLSELKQPEKSAEFIRHCDYWNLVISEKDIVKDGELPDSWGLMVFNGEKLIVKKKAPRLTPRNSFGAMPPVDRGLLVSFLRRVQEQSYNRGVVHNG